MKVRLSPALQTLSKCFLDIQDTSLFFDPFCLAKADLKSVAMLQVSIADRLSCERPWIMGLSHIKSNWSDGVRSGCRVNYWYAPVPNLPLPPPSSRAYAVRRYFRFQFNQRDIHELPFE